MKIYTEEALVYIWPYVSFGHPGHAAIKIRKTDYGQVYVSWWPGASDGKKGTGPFSIRPADPHQSYLRDKKAEMKDAVRQALMEGEKTKDPSRFQKYGNDPSGDMGHEFMTAANKKFNLPGLGSTVAKGHTKQDHTEDGFDNVAFQTALHDGEASPWGLRLAAMADWWQNFAEGAKKHGYRFVSTEYNCSGVAMTCLLEGGADAYVDIASAKMYRTPNDVATACNDLIQRIEYLNIETPKFKRKIADKIVKLNQQGKGLKFNACNNLELWTYKQFYDNSYVGMLDRRKEQVANIDTYLQEYHKAGKWDFDNTKIKFKCLARMMYNVIQHRLLKPTSNRGDAVEVLGMQILNVLAAGIMSPASLAAILSLSAPKVKTLDSSVKKEKKIG